MHFLLSEADTRRSLESCKLSARHTEEGKRRTSSWKIVHLRHTSFRHVSTPRNSLHYLCIVRLQAIVDLM